jgi:hypothetical protein
MPTATPTIPAGCPDLLSNGGFETGSLAPWVKDGPAGVSTPGRNSAFHAWLGGQDNAEAEVFQWVDVPAGIGGAPFVFWWRADVGSEQPEDALSVLVQYDDHADQVHTMAAVAPLNEWRRAQVDLSNYAGMHVLVTFHAHTDGSTPTTFRVDDTALLACGLAPSTPTPTPTLATTRTPTPTTTPTPTATIPAGCPDFLVNGGFETGSLAPWVKDSLAGVSTPGRTGAFHAWLGGQDDVEAEVFQWVDLPAGVNSVPLIFWWRADVASEQPDDHLFVLVQYDDQVDPVYAVRGVAPLDQWRRAEVDLSNYAGMHVLVTFHAHTDGAVPTTFRVDDAALLACGPPRQPTFLPLTLRDS